MIYVLREHLVKDIVSLCAVLLVVVGCLTAR